MALSAAGAVAVSAVLPAAAASAGELLHASCCHAVHLLAACWVYSWISASRLLHLDFIRALAAAQRSVTACSARSLSDYAVVTQRK